MVVMQVKGRRRPQMGILARMAVMAVVIGIGQSGWVQGK